MGEDASSGRQLSRRDFIRYGLGGGAMYMLQRVFPRLAENVATFSEWERGFYDDATNPQAEFSPLYSTLAQIPTLSRTAAENDPPSEPRPNFVDLYREGERFAFGMYGRVSFQGMNFYANAISRGGQDALKLGVAVDPRMRRVQGAQLKDLFINSDYDVSLAVMQAELIGYNPHAYITFHVTGMTTEVYPQKGFTDVGTTIRGFRAQSARSGRAPASLDKIVIIDLSQKEGNQSVNGAKDPINTTVTLFKPTKVKGHILWEGDYQPAMRFLNAGETVEKLMDSGLVRGLGSDVSVVHPFSQWKHWQNAYVWEQICLANGIQWGPRVTKTVMPPQTVSSVLIDARASIDPSHFHTIELRYVNNACITHGQSYQMGITPDQNLADAVSHMTSLREFQSRFNLDGWHKP